MNFDLHAPVCCLSMTGREVFNMDQAKEMPTDELIRCDIELRDDPNVDEYLILYSVFLQALERHELQSDDACFVQMADGIFPATVLQNDSQDWTGWKKYLIQWEEGDQERVSSWEVTLNSKPWIPKSAFTAKERKDMIRRLNQALEEEEDFVPFIDPVPYQEYPDYLWVVSYPLSFSQILERLENNYYRHKQALAWDVLQIAKNAMLYNSEESELYVIARDQFPRFIRQVFPKGKRRF
jgi:hypothetical protein